MEENKMKENNLSEQLRIEGNAVYNGSKEIFRGPFERGLGSINVLATPKNVSEGEFSRMYLGTGSCCYGHLMDVQILPGHDKAYLSYIISVDLCVTKMLPVKGNNPHDRTDAKCLVAGAGCSGGGVRLIDAYSAEVKNIFSTEEYWGLYPFLRHDVRLFMPEMRMRENKIYLDCMLYEKTSPKIDIRKGIGQLVEGIDLSDRLEKAGVDLEKTIEKIKGYKIIHSD
jgi:hypothetical protein